MKMTDVVDDLPPNESRVLMTDNATWGFAYVKDGMFQWDGSADWNPFDRENYGLTWMIIGDLKKLMELTDLPIVRKELEGRIEIPVSVLEFQEGGNTIWVQSPEGGTTMRIKCTGNIIIDRCQNSPLSHCDIMIQGDINFCLSKDSKTISLSPGEQKLYERALESPALKWKSDRKNAMYPSHFKGRVPLKIVMTKTVSSDLPKVVQPQEIIALNKNEYFCWVNSFGAVAAILPNGKDLGLTPDEFEVTAWH